jgi:hypothetical protein
MAKIEQEGVEGLDDVDLVRYVLGQMKKEIRYPFRELEMVSPKGDVVRDR